jgi:hypothetical protein
VTPFFGGLSFMAGFHKVDKIVGLLQEASISRLESL